ncbi:MAG: MltA domain-containing protein, partial [Alphaproteobacteria bacterium]|nr:MltA domain-containing protein [Alphaproteobacteria bacterium]
MRIFLIFFLCFLAACGEEEIPEVKPLRILKATHFHNLPGWVEDDFSGFASAFEKSCERFAKKDPEAVIPLIENAGTYGDMQKICLTLGETPKDNITLRHFFEKHFTPYQMYDHDNPIGLFTGYYEASLRGAWTKNEPYTIPLHARPDDLVMVNLGEFREELKGQRIAGRVTGGNLKPYENRTDIVSGNWPHEDKVLLWVDDPVDAFFVQIQGSGLVEMDDGSLQRIGYAGQNGHPYYAIGRELIKRGALTKENVSMQSIRGWLADNPDKADEIMNSNASYVFFRTLDQGGPIGAEGVVLTAERSLAVDRTMLPYGLPMWVDIKAPIEGMKDLRKMM